MQKLHDVMCDQKPEEVVVYPTSVMVLVSCEEVEVEDEMSGSKSTKYKCDIEQYDVDEYIDKLQKVVADQDSQMTQTQLALVEVYEMLLG